jgi:hypothetical protein
MRLRGGEEVGGLGTSRITHHSAIIWYPGVLQYRIHSHLFTDWVFGAEQVKVCSTRTFVTVTLRNFSAADSSSMAGIKTRCWSTYDPPSDTQIILHSYFRYQQALIYTFPTTPSSRTSFISTSPLVQFSQLPIRRRIRFHHVSQEGLRSRQQQASPYTRNSHAASETRPICPRKLGYGCYSTLRCSLDLHLERCTDSAAA